MRRLRMEKPIYRLYARGVTALSLCAVAGYALLQAGPALTELIAVRGEFLMLLVPAMLAARIVTRQTGECAPRGALVFVLAGIALLPIPAGLALAAAASMAGMGRGVAGGYRGGMIGLAALTIAVALAEQCMLVLPVGLVLDLLEHILGKVETLLTLVALHDVPYQRFNSRLAHNTLHSSIDRRTRGPHALRQDRRAEPQLRRHHRASIQDIPATSRPSIEFDSCTSALGDLGLYLLAGALGVSFGFNVVGRVGRVITRSSNEYDLAEFVGLMEASTVDRAPSDR